jgi:DUF1680 family protein
VYGQKDNDVYVNLFAKSTTTVEVHKKEVQIEQQNNYPWEGNLKFVVTPKSPVEFNLLIRIPGWAANNAMPSSLYTFSDKSTKNVEIKVNNRPVEYKVENGYAVLKKNWKKGDVVEVTLPMEVRRVTSSSQVTDNIGKVALQRGPLVYCAEWADNQGRASNFILPANLQFKTEFRNDLLNGVVILKTETMAVLVAEDGMKVTTTQQPFTAIPYYAWAHRGKGEMMVWFPQKVTNVDLISR